MMAFLIKAVLTCLYPRLRARLKSSLFAVENNKNKQCLYSHLWLKISFTNVILKFSCEIRFFYTKPRSRAGSQDTIHKDT